MAEIRGLLERITFANEENGYVVYKIAVKDLPDIVAAVGYTTPHLPGEELELTGEWSEHPKFGRQFKFESCKSVRPSSIEGIKRFLGGGTIKGIGPKTAERIVDAFGEKTLDVIDSDPDRLLEVRGVSSKVIETIKSCWESQREFSSVMIFLQGIGVSPGFAGKIFAVYGAETVAVVREDPYRLASEIFGIGFLTADKVAASMGIAPNDPKRIAAGVSYTTREMTGEGHVYAPRGELARRAADLLGVDAAAADSGIDAAKASGDLISEIIRSDGDDVEAVYLPAYLTAERASARMIAELISYHGLDDLLARAGALPSEGAAARVQRTMGIELARAQLAALELALTSKVMIITGGPGTGKTTIIRAIISIWGERGLRVLLAAPTGRAAKRMSEATGCEAKTIHRMLEFGSPGEGFGRNADNKLECDLLVVDEASMIDTILFYHLLRAVPKDCRLILVGDIHQLPSVGPGNVLKDLISSGAVPTAELNEIFRQASTSNIIVNAHRVNTGEMPIEPEGSGLRDFYIVERDEPERCAEIVVKTVAERIKAAFGLDPFEDVQVLTPMHRGTLGAANLNRALQEALNGGDRPCIERGSSRFKVGDKVMQTRNDYEKDIYNGDIGIITRVDPEAGLLWISVDGREIAYEAAELDELTLAYAISIHKSQGSEYPAVVIPIHTQHYVMLQRNLLYTAITRGKELVVIVGTKKALAIAAHNDDTKRRYTHLAARVADACAIF